MIAPSRPALCAALACLLGAAAACAQPPAAAPTKPASLTERVGYALGLNVGRSLQRDKIEVDLDQLRKGIEDALAGREVQMSDEEIQATMQELQDALQQRQAAAGETNQVTGDQYLAENAKRPGVTTLPSGLQYEVVKEGSGAAPSASDTVTVHYRGTLIDGTQFDSSYDRGQPATFTVGGVIAGWTEALQLMKPGAVWKLYIPAKLAYGAGGRPGSPIGPNTTLLFDVELIKVGN